MSFTIYFYYNKSETNAVNKDFLPAITAVSGVLRSGTSLLDPEIEVQLNELPKFNYAYIPEFNNRYYFIVDIESVRNNLWLLKMHVDVLETYKNSFMQLNAMVMRNEKTYNALLIDDKYVFEKQYKLEHYEEIDLLPKADSTAYNGTGNEPRCVVFTVGDPFFYTRDKYSKLDKLPTNPSDPYNINSTNIHTYICKLHGDNSWAQFANLVYEKSTEYGQYLLSAYLCPFDLTKFIGINNLEFRKIRIGGNILDIEAYCISSGASCTITKYVFITDKLHFDYTDYKPYSKFVLSLPFYGDYEIDVQKFLALVGTTLSHILVSFTIDFTDCTYSIGIYAENKSNTYLMDTLTGTCGSALPLILSNLSDNQRQRQSNLLNYIGSVIQDTASGATTFTTGLVSENPYQASRGLANMVGGIASNSLNYAAKENMIVDSGEVKRQSLNDYLNFFTVYCTDIILYHYTSVSAFTNDNGYSALYGKPLYRVVPLSNLKGYTEVDSIHLENINCTLTEKAELDELLHNGFIIL